MEGGEGKRVRTVEWENRGDCKVSRGEREGLKPYKCEGKESFS